MNNKKIWYAGGVIILCVMLIAGLSALDQLIHIGNPVPADGHVARFDFAGEDVDYLGVS